MKKEKVLITGGAGYLGNRITRDLLDNGYEVTILDDLRYNQGTSIAALASNENFEFEFGDVRNEGLVKKLVKDRDVIIPLAAIVGAPACEYRPHDAITINEDSVKQINHIRGKDQKLICPISNSGYGAKTGEEFCTENTSLDPITLYGKTKVNAEKDLLESRNGKDAISLRLATVFGISERMRRDLMVNDFVYKALTDRSILLFEGGFKRNFVHIGDVSRAFLHCIENYQDMAGEAYNVGLDEANMSKRDLANKVKEHCPKFEISESDSGKDPDKRNYIVSNEKLRQAGFEAEVSIDQGIEELIKAYDILLRNIPYTNL